MSSFYCDECGALCLDTELGYITGCKHYPPDLSEEEYERRKANKPLKLGKGFVRIPIGEPRFMPLFGPIRPGGSE